MELTKEILKEKFREYNKLYFDNKLGKCKFGFLFPNNYSYGKYRDDLRNGQIISTILLGKCIEWNEERLKTVLIHEMIHMYVRTVDGIKHDGILGHGYYFKKHCKHLKNNYGIIINIHNNFEFKNKKKSPPKMWERFLMWLIDR